MATDTVRASVGDLIKGAEAALFGSHEWTVEQLQQFTRAPELLDRLAAADALLRAYHEMGEHAHADRAAALVAETEGAVMPESMARVQPVRDAREKLLDAESRSERLALSQPFLEAFHRAWLKDKTGLVFDAALAALVQANLLATHKQETPMPGAPEWHVMAAHLYEEIGDVLEARVRRNEMVWQETARAAWNRAVVAWRLAREESKAMHAGERVQRLSE